MGASVGRNWRRGRRIAEQQTAAGVVQSGVVEPAQIGSESLGDFRPQLVVAGADAPLASYISRSPTIFSEAAENWR